MSEEEKHAEAPRKYTAKNVEPDTKTWEKFQNADGSRRKKPDAK
jgi:hypothetical protein